MNWEMIAAISGIVFIQGCIMIAAAKSIFVTQTEHDSAVKSFDSKHDLMIKNFDSKLYDKGITIFVPRKEWAESKIDRERRRDVSQRMICNKMAKMQKSIDEMSRIQNKTNESISHLLGRFEQQLEQEEN